MQRSRLDQDQLRQSRDKAIRKRKKKQKTTIVVEKAVAEYWRRHVVPASNVSEKTCPCRQLKLQRNARGCYASESE